MVLLAFCTVPEAQCIVLIAEDIPIYRTFNSVPGLYSSYARNSPQIVTLKNVSRDKPLREQKDELHIGRKYLQKTYWIKGYYPK